MRANWIVTVALLVTAAVGIGAIVVWDTAPTTPQAQVDAAYKAMGMTDVKLAPEEIVTLVVKGSMHAWDPGQSVSVSDPYEPADWGTSTFTQSWDRSRGLHRIDWMRPNEYGGRNYTAVISDQFGTKFGGYVMGNDVLFGGTAREVQDANNVPMHTMSGVRLTAEMRELERNNIVDLMHQNPDRVSDYPAQNVGGKSYSAVQYRSDYGTFIVFFDPATSLPAIVRTRDYDVYAGDANYDQTLSDWRDIGRGVKMPFRQVTTINGMKIFDTTLSSVTLNPQLPADTFAVPAVLRGKAAPPASVDKVRYQWILRRLGSGFYLDSDTIYSDEGESIKLEDVAPNISLTSGTSHNALIVATETSLVAFDAPGDDGLSRIVMDLAAQKYPGKPFKYVVLTHHHIDHAGGLRAYAAAGATIVVGKGNGDYYRKVLSTPQQLNPFQTKSVPPQVIEVDGKWSVNEGGRTIEAHSLDNPHASGYLIPYVSDAKFGFVSDLWSPGIPGIPLDSPISISLVKGVQRMGIPVEKFAGGHGWVGNFADLAKAIPE